MAQDTYNHISFEDDEEEVFVVGAAAASSAPTARQSNVSSAAETYEDAQEIADEVAAFYDVAAEDDFGVSVAVTYRAQKQGRQRQQVRPSARRNSATSSMSKLPKTCWVSLCRFCRKSLSLRRL